MQRRSGVGVGVGIALGVVTLALAFTALPLRSTSTGPPRRAMHARQVTAHSIAAASPGRSVGREPGAAVGDGHVALSPERSPPRARGAPDAGDVEPQDDAGQSVLRSVLEGDTLLSRYWALRNQPLHRREQRAGYLALLSDPAMHEKVRHELLHPNEAWQDARRNLQQLMEVDYLADALSWPDNPRREALLDLLATTIGADNFTRGADLDQRRTKATVKMELYALLFALDPARAHAVVEAARGTRLEGLLQFIAEEVRRRERVQVAMERRPGVFAGGADDERDVAVRAR
ncbi:hypothetical protein [Chondromyces crocatus]|uniref:Uncharacterized protein n=1 Tax=Chondromyces crocatus TaxID=52 RepID=A0A0K1E7B7_CHOCO|nr:hypothetical protein [Chondromyces crocatus]AKT36754.1 uncharacterized protein CMC5_008750 [Chondromyces crocatus]